MQELKSFLIKQKYPEAINECGLERAMSLDRDILRAVKVSSIRTLYQHIIPVIQKRTEQLLIPYQLYKKCGAFYQNTSYGVNANLIA